MPHCVAYFAVLRKPTIEFGLKCEKAKGGEKWPAILHSVLAKIKYISLNFN